MRKNKTWEITLTDNARLVANEPIENAVVYTTDTEAYLNFRVIDSGFEFDSATIAMLNKDDGSIVERPMIKEDGTAVYEIESDIIPHFGLWQAQVLFKQGEEIFTSTPVTFVVERYMMAEQPPRLEDVTNWKRLYDNATETIRELTRINDELNTTNQNVQQAEAQRVLAENERKEKYGSYAQQFNDVIKELSEEKDYHSLPEIAGARGGFDTLGERLDKEYNEVTTQLAQKVDKGNVSVSDINKNLGKFDQTFMTDEFIAQFVENTQPINTVPADGSVTSSKIVDKSIGFRHVSFITQAADGKNYLGSNIEIQTPSIKSLPDKIVGINHVNFITQGAGGKYYLGSNIEIQAPSIKSLPNNVVGVNQSTYITTGSNGKHYLAGNILVQKNSVSDVNAEIGIKEQPLSEIRPLTLPNTFGFDEAVHPTVVYVPGSFGGYKYWLVQTPIPYASDVELYIDRYEIPHVYASNDGYSWQQMTNPLDDISTQEIANGAYMSDPHIIYRPDIKQLEVFYRLTKGGGLDGYKSSHETQLLRKTSTDGMNWTEREVILEMGPSYSDNLDLMISQAVIWENTQKKYRFWYNNYSGNVLQRDWDGTTWGEIKTVGVSKSPASTVKYQEKWHLDVAYYRGKYHMTTYDFQENEINYWVSNDGLYFAFVKNLLKSSRDAQPLYAGGLYRPVTILDENGNQRLYVSGRQANGGKSTVFCITQNQITNINFAGGKTRIENAVFENGMTATEIVSLITSII